MRSIRDNLQKLPKSFEDNPQAELWSLCLNFTRAVNEYADGKSDTGGNKERSCFLQQSDPHYFNFQADILRTRPKFQVSPRKDVERPDTAGQSQDQEGINTLIDLAKCCRNFSRRSKVLDQKNEKRRTPWNHALSGTCTSDRWFRP
jgi:hypothetical protein